MIAMYYVAILTVEITTVEYFHKQNPKKRTKLNHILMFAEDYQVSGSFK